MPSAPPPPIAWQLTLLGPASGPGPAPTEGAVTAEVQRHAQDQGLRCLEAWLEGRSHVQVFESSWRGYVAVVRAWLRRLLPSVCERVLGQVEPVFTAAYRALVAAGDRQVMENFVDVYGPRCQQAVRQARRKYLPWCPRVPQEEDVVAEVWRQLLDKIDRVLCDYDVCKGTQVGWLYTIVYRDAHTYLRRLCSEPIAPPVRPGDPDGPPPPEGPEVDPPAMEELLGDHRLLSQLLAEYRESCKPEAWVFFQAVFLEESTVEELCQRFQVSEAVVYTRKLRALKKLREMAKRWLAAHGEPA